MVSAYVLAVCLFHVVLIDLGVVESGVDADVAEETLHLLNGHALVDGHGSHGAAELVGVNMVYIRTGSYGTEAAFHPTDGQAGMRCVERDEERRIIIGTGA